MQTHFPVIFTRFSFFCRFVPFGYLYFSCFFFSTNEPELGAGIDPGMALNVDHFNLVFCTRFEPTTFRSYRESSSLTTRSDLRSLPDLVGDWS